MVTLAELVGDKLLKLKEQLGVSNQENSKADQEVPVPDDHLPEKAPIEAASAD